MSRYTGPKTKINRRFRMAVFPADAAFERKPYPPGQHGPRLRRKQTPFSIGLDEKQKLRYMYGLAEKQFKKVFAEAKRRQGVTGTNFLQLLETRLDSVVYKAGFTRTRMQARQFVGHGHVLVNGKKVDCPSFACNPGDIIQVRDRKSSLQIATRALDDQFNAAPAWLAVEADAFKATVDRLPTREELTPEINEQLIVEFYSR